MSTREGALGRAVTFLDDGGFEQLLSDLVAIPSTSQEEAGAPALAAYLGDAMQPWLERLGFERAGSGNSDSLMSGFPA